MDYRELFSKVHTRPGMYGIPDNYDGFCAFIEGVNFGNEGQFLAGFKEFLVVRAGKGPNLVWQGLVAHVAFPGHDSLSADFLAAPERQRHLVDTLFQVLDEFLERRSRHGELTKIFAEYLEWRRSEGLS